MGASTRRLNGSSMLPCRAAVLHCHATPCHAMSSERGAVDKIPDICHPGAAAFTSCIAATRTSTTTSAPLVSKHNHCLRWAGSLPHHMWCTLLCPVQFTPALALH